MGVSDLHIQLEVIRFKYGSKATMNELLYKNRYLN